MSATLPILVATMSGTAEFVAEEVAAALAKAGRKAEVLRMERASPELLIAAKLVLICSSTYGTGEVPDNGKPFYAALQSARPDLGGLAYGVIALGDMTYSATFCGGGRRFDELLQSLGAHRIGTRLQLDARSGIFPEEAALAWLGGWLPLLEEQDAEAQTAAIGR